MPETSPETLFRVFISASEDVAVERALAAQVFAELAQEFDGRVGFVLVGATGAAPLAKDRPSSCDLVLCVLWKNLGATLPASYDRPDGTSRTGIEFEFEDALNAALRGESPDILVYKKRVLIDVEQADQARSELRALNAFWEKWFRNEQGHFTASFDGFETAAEFADKLRRHIRQWLLRRRLDVTWPVELKGSPYRSLEPFEAEHAGVFFGRRRAIRQVVSKLAAAAARGCGFLLVVGGSGTGKSSLVRAGVIPWLTEHGVVPDVAEWRSAIVRPAALGDDPLLGLAKALFDRKALPELANGDYPTPERFAALAARGAEAPAILVSAALRSIHPTRESRLVLLVDQLEELLARPQAAWDGLIRLLDALARGGRLWVIATLRSDRYPEFQASPDLLRLKDDGDSFDLLPPDQAEIRDIIEGPARAAGLTLEESGDRSLTALLEDASRERGALPLLQFTLHRLFVERDAANGRLLLSVYDRLGGLAGAIAAEADRTVSALPDSLQAALPRLLINLVEVEDGKEIASARLLPRSDLADPDAQALAERLVDGRFLVVDGNGPTATLRLAHEALLTHWPRLADVIREHRAFLETRSRLNHGAAIWSMRDRHADFLLPSGRRLAEAADALAAHRPDLDATTIAFVEASVEAERQRVAEREEAARRALQTRAEAAEMRALAARRLVGRTRIAAAVVTVLLLAMAATAGLWLSQRQIAQARAAEAEQNYATALKAALEGVRTVSQARFMGQLPNDVAAELLDTTRTTFDKLGGDNQSADVMATRIELLDEMAQSAYLAGKFADALDPISKELALANQLAQREPANDKWQWSLTRAHELLGQWSEQAGDLPAAAEHFQEMSAVADRMAAKLPDSLPWRNWKSLALTHHAEIARLRGNLPQAAADLREALARFTAAAQAAGGTPIAALDEYFVAAARVGLCPVLLAQGDVAGALEQARAAQATTKLFGDKDKGNHNWRFLGALAAANLGDAQRVNGDLSAAYDAFQESITVGLSLSKADQDNYLLKNNFAAAGRGKADVFLDEGQAEKALKLYRLVLETIAPLAETDPTNTFWQRNLGQMHGRVGDALMDAKDAQGAEQEYRAGLAVTQKLATKDPSNADWQRELSLSHMRLADLLHAKGDDAGALAEDRARMAIVQRLGKTDPTSVALQRDLVAAHGRLGLDMAALGDTAAAHDEFAACVAQPRPAHDTDPVYNRREDMHDTCERQLAAAK